MSAIDGKRTLAEILKVAGKDVDERRALRFFRATLAIRPGRLQRIACCKLIKLDSMDSTITALPFAAAMLIGMVSYNVLPRGKGSTERFTAIDSTL